MLKRLLTALKTHSDVIGFCMIAFGTMLLILAWVDACRI